MKKNTVLIITIKSIQGIFSLHNVYSGRKHYVYKGMENGIWTLRSQSHAKFTTNVIFSNTLYFCLSCNQFES